MVYSLSGSGPLLFIDYAMSGRICGGGEPPVCLLHYSICPLLDTMLDSVSLCKLRFDLPRGNMAHQTFIIYLFLGFFLPQEEED